MRFLKVYHTHSYLNMIISLWTRTAGDQRVGDFDLLYTRMLGAPSKTPMPCILKFSSHITLHSLTEVNASGGIQKENVR